MIKCFKKAIHIKSNFEEASDLYMKLSTFWEKAKIKNQTTSMIIYNKKIYKFCKENV